MDRDRKIHHPRREHAYQRGIFSTSSEHESDDIEKGLKGKDHTSNAHEKDNNNDSNGGEEDIAKNAHTSNAHDKNNNNGPWSPTLPSSYPTPLHAYGHHTWEDGLETKVELNGGERGGEDPPNAPRLGPHLRSKAPIAVRLLMLPLEELTKQPNRREKRNNPYQRAQWSDRALGLAMEAVDNGHSYSKVSTEYKIPRSNLRDHMNGKTTSKKMGSKSKLTAEEEMVDCGLF